MPLHEDLQPPDIRHQGEDPVVVHFFQLERDLFRMLVRAFRRVCDGVHESLMSSLSKAAIPSNKSSQSQGGTSGPLPETNPPFFARLPGVYASGLRNLGIVSYAGASSEPVQARRPRLSRRRGRGAGDPGRGNLSSSRRSQMPSLIAVRRGLTRREASRIDGDDAASRPFSRSSKDEAYDHAN